MRNNFKILGKVVLVVLAVIAITIVGWFCYLTYLDRSKQPSQLSGQEETIEVMYVNWACDCADFIDTSLLVEGYEIDAKDCMFIEPVFKEISINEDTLYKKQFNYFIKLKGQYYIDEGVPDSYERKVSEPMAAPNKARVFRYSSYEYVKK
ncbi:hypothetical protein LNQ81_00675 [Myroides sp. M-43]|uniref:hypothetical protein n=1 Tax=Myroides oncorhynchi TaxID=2893756 RepID=UPI001E384F4F|nr:hypothetical protein [Myroides oncorhynchi]MCC9041253.1 hypothetical protein [Myroides oncorhynchi]